jgi:predicted cupin superfamily sugar epimerase
MGRGEPDRRDRVAAGPTAADLIRLLDLKPLPLEGGYFRETYRSADAIEPAALPPRFRSPRALSTCIYYLLAPGGRSALHRLPADEVFHFYLGDPAEMLQLLPGGVSRRLVLGSDLGSGHHLQVVVPHGAWQGTRLIAGGRFALMGTTVAPGFDPQDFQAADAEALIRAYPGEAELIRALA